MKNKQVRSWWLICLGLTAVIFMGMDCQRKQVITVIGGYGWMAKFMDQKGYVATDGVYSVNTQYNFENTLSIRMRPGCPMRRTIRIPSRLTAASAIPPATQLKASRLQKAMPARIPANHAIR